VTLVVTDAALMALGMEADSAHTSLVERPQGAAAQDGGSADTRALAARTEPRAPRLRDGTKQARLFAMLERDEGATIEQIVAATGWQPHTVRGAIAGALKRKLGLTVASEKLEGERYRILR
jgi:hypothetical protein